MAFRVTSVGSQASTSELKVGRSSIDRSVPVAIADPGIWLVAITQLPTGRALEYHKQYQENHFAN